MEHRATSLNTARGDGMSVCININTQYIYILIIYTSYIQVCVLLLWAFGVRKIRYGCVNLFRGTFVAALVPVQASCS